LGEAAREERCERGENWCAEDFKQKERVDAERLLRDREPVTEVTL
jgi:hypothetical protein